MPRARRSAQQLCGAGAASVPNPVHTARVAGLAAANIPIAVDYTALIGSPELVRTCGRLCFHCMACAAAVRVLKQLSEDGDLARKVLELGLKLGKDVRDDVRAPR